jgi:coatomer subunit beta'
MLAHFVAQTEAKWKQLADLALAKSEFGLAQEALQKARDFGGLLLLSTSAGNADMVSYTSPYYNKHD